jgi:hypothetical protein
VTPETSSAIGERAQVILVWVRAPGVENTFHPHKLGVMRVRPQASSILWRPHSRMLKSTSIGGVN